MRLRVSFFFSLFPFIVFNISSIVAAQVNELNIIRQSLYDLETQHGKIRSHYEDELQRVRADGRAAMAAAAAAAGPPPPQGIASLGSSGSIANTGSSSSNNNSGSGGGAGGLGGPGGLQTMGPGGVIGLGGPPGLGGAGAPAGMYADPYYSRDGRDRERERERERDRERDRERERERDRMVVVGERGGGGAERMDRMMVDRDMLHLRPGEREREIAVREREREREQRERERDARDRMVIDGPPSHREMAVRDRDRDRDRDRERDRDRDRSDRLVDPRDPKRIKGNNVPPGSSGGGGKDRPDHFSPSLGPGQTPKLPPPPSSTANPSNTLGLGGPSSSTSSSAAAAAAGNNGGGGAGGNGNPPVASATTGPAYPGSGGPGSMDSNSLGLIPLGASSSVGDHRSTSAGAGVGPPPPTSFPDDLDIHTIAPELKKEGSDWFAIFNPKVKRVLDVSLVHTLMHERWVLLSFFWSCG